MPELYPTMPPVCACDTASQGECTTYLCLRLMDARIVLNGRLPPSCQPPARAGSKDAGSLRYVAARSQHFHNLTEQLREHLRGEPPLFPGMSGP